jgi:hypothetical protein
VDKLVGALKIHKDQVYECLEPYLENLAPHEPVWHKSCYKSYTHNKGLQRILSSEHLSATNLKNCIICQKLSDMNDKKLIIVNKQTWKTLREAADSKGDKCLLSRMDQDDDINKESRFHRNCYAKYTAKYEYVRTKCTADAITENNIEPKTEPENDIYLKIFNVAKFIREAQKKCQGMSTNPIRSTDISNEKAFELLPECLYMLLKWILEGGESCLDKKVSENESMHRLILSIGQDIVSARSHFKVKMPKNVGLGMTVYHLTRSKQIIKLLHNLGHSVSYDEVLRLETALSRNVIQRFAEDGVVVPSNIHKGSFIQAAADNLDFCEETLDGRNTTHATTLVLYQRNSSTVLADDTSNNVAASLRARSLDSDSSVLKIQNTTPMAGRGQPFSLTGKLSDTFFEASDEIVSDAATKDMLWLISRSCSFDVDTPTSILALPDGHIVPAWSGFNRAFSSTDPDITRIGYCTLFAASPTNPSTVYAVMKTVQNISKKLQQSHSVITFDQAIYCKAKEIQWNCPEEFSDTVIRLGGFHIAMTFLATIGKRFEGTGFEDVLIEAGVYGSTTAECIIKGKQYNRSIRAHKLLYEAMAHLRWQSAKEWLASGPDSQIDLTELDTQISSLQDALKSDDGEVFRKTTEEVSPSLMMIKKAIDSFREFGRRQSATFTLWDEYIHMVGILLRFIRSERDGNWKLHLNSVAEMLPFFFAYDRTNYSRWASIYLADMNRLPETAPFVHQQFLLGNHPVKRSNGRFNQVWTDQALEQSINRDSKMIGGLVGISTKTSARDKWFLTAHETADITTAVKVMSGLYLCSVASPHKDSGANRVERDARDVQQLMDILRNHMLNPFALDETEYLAVDQVIILSSRVLTPVAVCKDLLEAETLGKTAMKSFLQNRLQTSAKNFHDPLPNMKLKTCATTNKKAPEQSKKAEKKTHDGCTELFGRLLIAAQTRDFDIPSLFAFELATVPSSLANSDQSLRKTCKSKLLTEIEKDAISCKSLPPFADSNKTCWILDGMAILHTVQHGGKETFGDLADVLLDVVLRPFQLDKSCARIDIVFDRYDNPLSIKEMERSRRQSADSSISIHIKNEFTRIPLQWLRFITSSANKMQIIQFLGRMWREKASTMLKQNQMLLLAGMCEDVNEVCQLTSNDTNFLTHLRSTHEEADTRILLHCADASHVGFSRIVVSSPDTDVAILCIHFCKRLVNTKELWMKTGIKERERFIPIHSIADKYGTNMCHILPAIHALTGCDSTSAFKGIGKGTVLKRVKENVMLLDDLRDFGSFPLQKTTLDAVHRFVVSLYDPNAPVDTPINQLRYRLFCKNKGKSQSLPPTADSLQLHAQRANYQTGVWRNSFVPCLELPHPSNNGWRVAGGALAVTWTTMPSAPESLSECVRCGCKSTCTGRCSCRNQNQPCTDLCGCGEKCSNRDLLEESDEDSDAVD